MSSIIPVRRLVLPGKSERIEVQTAIGFELDRFEINPNIADWFIIHSIRVRGGQVAPVGIEKDFPSSGFCARAYSQALGAIPGRDGFIPNPNCQVRWGLLVPGQYFEIDVTNIGSMKLYFDAWLAGWIDK